MTNLDSAYFNEDPVFVLQLTTKQYVGRSFQDLDITEITKNTDKHYDFIDKNLQNIRFVKVFSVPDVASRLAPKENMDTKLSEKIDEASLLQLHPDRKFD